MSRKKIYSIEDLSKNVQDLFDTLNDGSELACVLIGASFLDETLRTLLLKYFVEDVVAQKLLNSTIGALGTYSGCCDVALCLGLITHKAHKDLKTIGEIRNKFAHSHLTKSFSDQKIVDLVNKLTYYNIFRGTLLFKDISKLSPDQFAKNKFKFTVVILSQELILNGHGINHRKPKGQANISV